MPKNLEQWTNLSKHITSQYAETSTQKEVVTGLNEQAAGYYQRLYQALPEGAAHRFEPVAPLVYFAEDANAAAELIVSGKGYPPLISLPDSGQSLSTMIYGVTRAFLEQTPEMLAELTASIQKRLPDQQAMIVGVLGDLVAKQIGIALLFKPEKLKDYLLSPAKPKQAQAEVEIKPTVGLLVPYLGLATLRQLLGDFLGADEPARKQFEQRLEQITTALDNLLAPHLDKPCEPVLNLKGASLRAMRDALLATVNVLLSRETTLKALQGRSLFELLLACTSLTSENPQKTLADWGNVPQFLAALPDLLPSAQIVPLPLSSPSGINMTGVPGFFDPFTVIALILAIIGL